MDIEAEAEQLKSAWQRYPAELLDNYLVHGVENPCFNPQSVVMRSLIIEALKPNQHRALMQEERLYCACACHILQAMAERRHNALAAALDGDDHAYPLPEFLKNLRDNKTAAPFSASSVWMQIFHAALGSFSNFTSPFEALWRERLSGLGVKPIQLLETGCGSANDYRYFQRYGLEQWVDHTGVDICPANIANARRRCPKGRFLESNAVRLPFPDKSFDFYLTFDLLEHLSIEAFERAVAEAARVTRRGLWLSFFQLEERPEHEVVPDPPYHRNILSLDRTLELLAGLGCATRMIDIPNEWAREFPGYRHYNPRGRMIEARIRESNIR